MEVEESVESEGDDRPLKPGIGSCSLCECNEVSNYLLSTLLGKNLTSFEDLIEASLKSSKVMTSFPNVNKLGLR